jgi:tetratricopeptide (TPR) repeat protein
MKQVCAAAAFAFLMASSGAAQQSVPPQQVRPLQTSGTPPAAASEAQRPRTPREDQELQADLMMVRKQYAEAAALYQKLIQQEPRNAVLLNKLGIAYHQQTMLGEAKRYYERAAKADRTYATPHNNIGTIYYQRRDYRKAIRAYKKALQLDPNMAAVYSNLGYAYFGEKHYDEAMDAFHQALALDPTVFDRGRSVGSLLQDRTVSDHGLFYFFLAKSFATMGNGERCAEYLKKARDEGYAGLDSAKTDPAFAGVLKHPAVAEVLQLAPPATKPPAVPPGS